MTEQERTSRTRLYKNRRKGKVSGVCAGIADYLGVSATPFRVIFAISLIWRLVTIRMPTVTALWMLRA